MMNMFFLVHYRRSTMALLRFDKFPTMEEAVAAFSEDTELNCDMDLEKVLLASDSEETLRRTHSRYFGPIEPEAFAAAL